MAHVQSKTKPRKSFLRCFGFFRKNEKFSVNLSVKLVEPNNYNNITRSKKSESSGTGLFSWLRFRMKNVSAVKTVPIPIDTTEIHPSKSKRKFLKLFKKRQHRPPKATTSKTISFHETPAVVEVAKDEAPAPIEIFQVEEAPEQNITLQNRQSLDHLDSSKGDTCQRRLSFCRKIDAIRTGSIQPSSPDVETKPARTAPTLSQSVSSSAPTREKRANPSFQTRVVPKKIRQDDHDNVTVNKFDPVVGMSIIMVTLIIMLIWGRFCAILCTSAWFYFVPILRASSRNDDVMMRINGEPDVNSEEYKRKVVLEGFLERDHRAVL